MFYHSKSWSFKSLKCISNIIKHLNRALWKHAIVLNKKILKIYKENTKLLL